MGPDLIEQECRKQRDDSLDCGVFICLWSECYARDSVEFWEQERIVNIDRLRALYAHTILQDKASTFRLGV